MADDKYLYRKVPEEYYYEFESEGPKRVIKKVVRYSLIEDSPHKIYNLGFGDWNEANQDIDDQVNTNDNDRQKVLGTIADTVIDFLKHNPNAAIFACGSTASRSRLYQMNILQYWTEITKAQYAIQGYFNDRWIPFEKGINFEAFIIRIKL